MIDSRLADLAGFIRNAIEDDEQLEIAKDFITNAEAMGAVSADVAESLCAKLFDRRVENFGFVIENIARYVGGEKVVLPPTYYSIDGEEVENEE